jgi:hypothetical protein
VPEPPRRIRVPIWALFAYYVIALSVTDLVWYMSHDTKMPIIPQMVICIFSGFIFQEQWIKNFKSK